MWLSVLHVNWLVWRDMHKPFLHTNHLSFSVLHMINGYVPSHKPSLHTNHLSFSVLHIILFVQGDMINGLCEVMVFVKGRFMWRDGLHIVWFVWRDYILSGLCNFTETRHNPSLHTNQIITQPIYHSLSYIPSHKPSLHTNHLSFSELHIIWFVWRDPFTQSIPSPKPSLNTKPSLQTNNLSFSVLHTVWFVWRHGLCDLYPSLQTNHLSFSVLHIVWFVWRDCVWSLCTTYCLVCLKGWILVTQRPDTIHPFTQTIYNSM